MLETVAAVPGMVGATINHLDCLRRMCDDKGWIKTLMDEAENERMHLMTFIEVAKPTLFERAVIIGVQWVFYLVLLRPLPGQLEDRAPRRRLFRGRSGDQLHPLSRGDRRGPLAQRARARRSPSATGACPTMRRCATWCWSSAPTRPTTATSTTASPTNWPACRVDGRRSRRHPTTTPEIGRLPSVNARLIAPTRYSNETTLRAGSRGRRHIGRSLRHGP